MSRKNRTTVPDFSNHKRPSGVTPGKGGKAPIQGHGKGPPAATPRIKPQATSAKSGRRGG